MNNIVFYLYYAMIGLVYAALVAGALYVTLGVLKTMYLIVSGKVAVLIDTVNVYVDRIQRIRRAKRIARRRERRREQAAYERIMREVKM